MTEDLQHLLEKIQKDGVDKADTESTRIIDEANAKAQGLIKKAEEKAKAVIEKAEKDGLAFAENGKKALEQAARDTIIAAKTGIQAAVTSVISTETAKAMDDDTLSNMLLKVVEAYCADSASTEVLVNEADVEKFKQFILNKLSEEARTGIEVVPDGTIVKGFKVLIKDKNVEHDLTDEAISASLAQVLRPHIAEILQKNV